MTTARKQSTGVMTKFGGTMKTAAASLIFKNRDPDFEHMLQFINSYQKKVQAFGLLSDEIAKTRFCKYGAPASISKLRQFSQGSSNVRCLIPVLYLYMVKLCIKYPGNALCNRDTSHNFNNFSMILKTPKHKGFLFTLIIDDRQFNCCYFC